MSMPGFNADDTLYWTSGHYRSHRSRPAINLPTQAINSIHPEARDLDLVGEEMILLEGAAPTPWGLPSGWGPGGWEGPHGSGAPVPSGPSGGRGKGGGGKTPPKKPPKVSEGCTLKQIQSKAARPCVEQMQRDVNNDVIDFHYVTCDGSKMYCCQHIGKGVARCDKL